MKPIPHILVVACFLYLVSEVVNAAPPPEPQPKPDSFWDRIFNIPRSVINSVNKNLNENGARCRDGSAPVNVDGKGTCHDNALQISRSAIDSVNDLLNG